VAKTKGSTEESSGKGRLVTAAAAAAAAVIRSHDRSSRYSGTSRVGFIPIRGTTRPLDPVGISRRAAAGLRGVLPQEGGKGATEETRRRRSPSYFSLRACDPTNCSLAIRALRAPVATLAVTCSYTRRPARP